MNKVDNKEFEYNGKVYKVVITYRRGMRNINYRYDEEKMIFKVNAPRYTFLKTIMNHLNKIAPSLIFKASKRSGLKAISEDSVFIFGRNMPYIIGNHNKYFYDHLEVKNKEGLLKLLKGLLSDYISDILPKYEKMMGVKHYKFSIRNMTSRHGSNRRSISSLSFALSLVHYNGEIIDSVIVHELAHDVHFNHSKEFYDLVLKYCPKYRIYKKALDRKDYLFGSDNLVSLWNE